MRFLNELISVCGLDCSRCDIFQGPFDPEAARSVSAWFERKGWKGAADVAKGSVLCRGCRGDRQVHWSADCAILKCCVDEKNLEFCSQCDTFPCERLTKRAEGDARYAQGLARLRRMREAAQS